MPPEKEKKLVQDVVSGTEGVRSSMLSSTEPPKFLTRKRRFEGDEEESSKAPINFGPGFRVSKTTPRKWWWWVLGAVVVVIFAFYFISFYFVTATVSVKTKELSSEVDSTFVAEKTTSDPSKLPFDVKVFEERLETTIPVTGTRVVERKAGGVIVVYNNFSRDSQKLIKTTRFETPDGKMYRTPNAITIPGQHMVSGKLVPGSVEVTVLADLPGEAGNIGLADFTVPGFKTDPARYKAFYARSKTPMTGGFKGEVKVVSPDALSEARGKLDTELKGKLEKTMAEKLPGDLITFPGAATITFALEDEYQSASDKDPDANKTYKVKELGKLSTTVFDKSIFSAFLAKRTLVSYTDGNLVVLNVGDLSFEPLSKLSALPNSDTFSFHVKGKARFAYTYDQDALKEALRGVKKTKYLDIFSSFPAIDTAEVVFHPPWARSFPSDSEKITITDVNG